MRASGFSAKELAPAYSCKELKKSGYDASSLRDQDFQQMSYMKLVLVIVIFI
jgi:hypothetical protein